MEEYDKDESYLVRERVYRDSLNLYFRIVVGNDSHCYQYMENGPEHSCTYVPHGSTTTLANVIAFIAEGFQQSEIVSLLLFGSRTNCRFNRFINQLFLCNVQEFDGHNRLNSLRLLHWKYSPIEGDYTFAFSTQTHTLNHPIEKIVATSKSTGFRVTYSDIKVQIDPQITSKMFQVPNFVFHPFDLISFGLLADC